MPRKRAAKAVKEKPIEPSELVLPTAAAIEDARKRRRAAATARRSSPGVVLGLPEGWVAAVMDPTLPDGEQSRVRAQWLGKGWAELDGLHTVSGYHSGAIVFVKTQDDYNAARKERAKRIDAARAAGTMHRRR